MLFLRRILFVTSLANEIDGQNGTKKRGRVLTHKAHQLGLGHQVFALKPDGTAIIHRILLSTHYSLDV